MLRCLTRMWHHKWPGLCYWSCEVTRGGGPAARRSPGVRWTHLLSHSLDLIFPTFPSAPHPCTTEKYMMEFEASLRLTHWEKLARVSCISERNVCWWVENCTQHWLGRQCYGHQCQLHIRGTWCREGPIPPLLVWIPFGDFPLEKSRSETQRHALWVMTKWQ